MGKARAWKAMGAFSSSFSFRSRAKPPTFFPSLDGVWMTGSKLPAGVPGGSPARRSPIRSLPLGCTRAPLPPPSRRGARGTAASLGETGHLIPRALRAALIAPVDTRNYLYFLTKILKTLGVFCTELASIYQKVFFLLMNVCFSVLNHDIRFSSRGFERNHSANRFLYS